MEKKPIRLEDCYKHYTFDQDKVCDPIETVNRFKNKLKEVTRGQPEVQLAKVLPLILKQLLLGCLQADYIVD